MKFLGVLATLLLSLSASASILGTWQGSGSLTEDLDGVVQNYKCSEVQFEVLEENEEIIIRMDTRGTNCGDSLNYHFGEINYGIRGSTLYKYSAKMGKISDTEINAQDRMCFMTRPCEYWDHVSAKLNEVGDLVLNLNFDDYSTSTWKNKFQIVLKRVNK